MFHCGCDDVFVFLAEALGCAENGPVIRFCTAGRKEYSIRLCAQGGSNLVSGKTHSVGRINAEAIQCAGVAPTVGQCNSHCLHSLFARLCGGRIVQIDHITHFPTQNRSKIRLVISSLTVAPVTSPMASMAVSTSVSTASGVRPSFRPCSAESIASYALRMASN